MTHLTDGAARDTGALTLGVDTNSGISLNGNLAKAFKIFLKNCIALGEGLSKVGLRAWDAGEGAGAA